MRIGTDGTVYADLHNEGNLHKPTKPRFITAIYASIDHAMTPHPAPPRNYKESCTDWELNYPEI